MKNINLFGSLTISAFLFSSLAFAGQSPIDDVEMEGDSNNVPYNLSAGAFDGNMVPIDALDVRDGFRVMRVPGIAIAVKDCALYGVMSQQGATEISNEQLVDIVDGKNKKSKQQYFKKEWIPMTVDEVICCYQEVFNKGDDQKLLDLIEIGAYTGMRIEEI